MSANDPIEEMFRDNQHGLDEKPRNLIWDRIEERLDEKSVQKKKIQWWRYAMAASVVAGVMIGIWALLNNPEPVSQMESAPMVYEAPEEVTKEKASEILDQLEEKNQSVVIHEEKKSAPEIYKEVGPAVEMKSVPEPVIEAAPAISYEETEISEEKMANEGAVVFRGDTPAKKEKNYISQKGSDERRRGNMAIADMTYSDSIFLRELQVRTKNYLINYTLVSEDESQIIFENKTIAYPSRIIFQKTNDSVLIQYEGKNSKRKSKESEEIREFIEENKQEIQSRFWKNQ